MISRWHAKLFIERLPPGKMEFAKSCVQRVNKRHQSTISDEELENDHQVRTHNRKQQTHSEENVKADRGEAHIHEPDGEKTIEREEFEKFEAKKSPNKENQFNTKKM